MQRYSEQAHGLISIDLMLIHIKLDSTALCQGIEDTMGSPT